VIYELIVYRWVYPGQALIVAVVLAIIPYLLVRGPVTRVARRFIQGRKNSNENQLDLFARPHQDSLWTSG
jgi:hypothetical protein